MKADEQKAVARDIFALALEAVKSGKPADKVISFEVKNRRFMGANDRRTVTDMVWNTFHNLAYLRWKLGDDAEAGELFDLSLKPRDLTGAPEYVLYDCPAFLFADMPKEEIKAMQARASFDLRVNISKMARDKVIQMFKMQGISAEKTPFSPVGLRMHKHFPLEETTAYKRGLVAVMDEGSQLVACKIAPFINKGDKVLDLCAGGGGKTLALFDLVAEKGGADFTATDISAERLEKLKARAKLAVFKVIKIEPLAPDYQPFLAKHTAAFDEVVVDAPCSGTGTWRRAPDAKWRTSSLALASYESEQRAILTKASQMVKKGGKLFYITCSLRQAENEAQVEWFLSENKSFTLLDSEYILPSKYASDGFFVAMIENK